MNDTIPAIGDTFDRLLSEMPRIAQAVNEFKSEKNQRYALEALVNALGVPAPVAPRQTPEPGLTLVTPVVEEIEDETVAEVEEDTSSVIAKPRVKKTAAKRTPTKKIYPRAKDINFRPEGKPSLRAFVDEKQATTNNDRNLLIVYYFENILEQDQIGVAEVLAGYDEIGCKPPSIPDNSLMVTASQKKWLDTSDTKKIRTTHKGRNQVEYDMPDTKKSKKSA